MPNWSIFLLASIPLLGEQYADYFKKQDLDKTARELEGDDSLPRIKSYDFIIVGGGTAGCLLASRLSTRWDVLLLEGGGDPPPVTYNPFLVEQLIFLPKISYVYDTVPLKNFYLENGGIGHISFGKMMGGSGSHNGNVHNRGNPNDWENFANLTGDRSWSYSSILKHFKELENFNGFLINEEERQECYAKNDGVTVETGKQPYLIPWLQGGIELGYKIGDPNCFQIESFTPTVVSIKNGERDSTYTTFIKNLESQRPRLTIQRYSVAEQILIRDKKAYGVAYKRHGIPQVAHAKNEVILSGGAIGSPMLLFKSGIGPKGLLEEANIPVELDLPGVGQNLRDHPLFWLTFTPTNVTATMLLLNNAIIPNNEVESEIMKYQSPAKSGKFIYTFGPQAFIMSSVAKEAEEGDWPDLQFVFTTTPIIGDGVPKVRPFVCLTRPKSVGQLGFNTSAYLAGERNDTKLALIDPAYNTDPRDIKAFIEGTKLLVRLIEETAAFQGIGPLYSGPHSSACDGFTPRSDEHWGCLIAQKGQTDYHFQGTCKMGKLDDPLAVVDSKLRLIGIKGLRIVDASIFPVTTNANTNAPVMVVAQKISTEIFSEYGSV